MFSSYNSLLTFCLVVLLIAVRGLLKSPTVNVDFPISLFSSLNFCFLYLDTLVFDTYPFQTVESWWVDSLISM